MAVNEEQRQVVEELDRNILLVASAGTGKTNTLAYRVAHIIKTGRAEASQILCMTFTNKACGEMKQRIESLVGASAKAVEVTTFHSFCYKVLQEESKLRASLFTDFIIFDEEDCRELWMPYKPARVNNMDFANLLGLVKEYRSLYGYYSDDPLVDYDKTVARLFQEEEGRMKAFFWGGQVGDTGDVDSFRKHGGKVLTAYDQALQAVHGLDFMDLVTQVHRLFQDPQVRERWRSRYSYIAVDEMQDTGLLEYRLMKLMWEGNHILLCGDYFQTIYEWRGSQPLVLLRDYEQYFNPVKVIFHENYRSNRTLFSGAFKTLQAMFPQLVAEVYDEMPSSHSQVDGPPILVHKAGSEQDEGAYIFKSIQSLPKDANVGILVRSNQKARSLSLLFEKMNQGLSESEQRQFMIIDEFKFFRRQEIKDIMAYFKLLLNPHDAVSAKRIVKRYVKGIGEARIKAIESPEARKAGLKLTDFLDMKIFEAEPYAALLQGLEEENLIVYDVESTGTDTTRDNIIQIAAVRIDRHGKVLETFDRLIKPEKSVGASEEVHHFSDALLAEQGEDPAVVLEDFRQFSKGRVVVGHNVNYDVSIFTSELHRRGMGKPEFGPIFDTLDIFRRFYPNLRNHKLEYLSNEFPVALKPSHNAFDDIMATAILLIYAVDHNIGPTRDMRQALISQYKSHFAGFASQMATLRRKSDSEKPTDLLVYIMKDMGVITYYEERNEMTRVEYIRDLYRIMAKLDQEYEALNGRDRLNRILQLSALTAGEPDGRIKNEDRIPIITIHQAKGSEFDHVFLAGMNAGSFPNFMAVKEGKMDEEKRLFYVALTRPKKELVITYLSEGNYGRPAKPSSFLEFLPKDKTLVTYK